MVATELRYGIVGCAGMGTNHADAVAKTDGATLVSCADIDDETARAFATQYGTTWYEDPLEMVVDERLDAVSICTPNGTHAEIVTALAGEGVDILCEKPLEVTPERVARIADTVEREGITFGCVLQRRTFGGPRLARDATRAGRLGEIVLGNVQVKWDRGESYYEDVNWHGTEDLDGGILLTQALHGIDLLQWTTGGIDRVAATTDTIQHDIEVPDTAVASVELSNGGYGQITATTAMYPQEPITLELHGTEGTLRWRQNELEAFETLEGAGAETPKEFYLGAEHLGQVRDFVQAIHENREPMIPISAARKPHDVVFAIQAAADREEWIDVATIREEYR
ncbi:Gfo/Idh/MocA family oxidoreductase [Halostagnicola sp. A-GB9-2]|uniref:Gfo/Idh/MocA family protein n=1 Tax=Halostagnicola sp. A-GB9-2 TaxID=3048066 RepID=UPI0024C09EED|nr:Gfo/Idh/MocA family oxidoreductase [Halostagnicola sp. A-GB9-2]MDJ1433627.1 Gfo/Idh/MocA family oxidoreductase [Halostagnicola sp. A-GB9-2]